MEDTEAPTQQERKKEMEKKKKEISVREEDHCYRDTTHIEQREMKIEKKRDSQEEHLVRKGNSSPRRTADGQRRV